jgi:hypothetical protein
MEIKFGASAYRRTNGRLPELRLVNMFLESMPASDGGVVLLSRRALVASTSAGTGPVTGVHWRDGLFGGDVFCVSGGVLYRGTTALGAIAGTGPVSFASSDFELVITAGAAAYSYNGTDLAPIAFPDGASVAAVAIIGDMFVFLRAGTHKFYWSAVLDGRTVDPLWFASAEAAPDALLDIVAIGDALWLLGSSTIESWILTGDLDLPFERIDQRLYRKGTAATGCAIDVDNAMFWIGSDCVVYRASEVPLRVSDHGIEERIARSTSRSAFSFSQEGHVFFCVRLDDATFAYDAATQQWCEFTSYGRANFRARCAASKGSDVLLGDDASGSLWGLSGSSEPDGAFERLFTAAFRIAGGAAQVHRLNVDVNVGWTELLDGQGSDPQLEMRYSRDAGATWSDWDASSMGRQGHYRERPEWRALGMFDFPGAMFEFRCTDPVDLRLSGVFVNEAGGGRSR